MNNTFSISFSDSAFQLIHVVTDNGNAKVLSSNNYSFTKQGSLDQVFSQDNISFVSKVLAEKREILDEVSPSIVFCLPFNFATIKTIPFPADSDKAKKKSLIEWELNMALSEDIKEYKISIINEFQSNDEFSEVTVVAIKRSLLKDIQSLADENETSIDGIFLNCFSIENFLEKTNFAAGRNHIFVKVNDKNVEHHFFNQKRHLTSFVDAIILNKNYTREQYIVELAQDRIKQVSNLVTPRIDDSLFNLILYGPAINNELLKMFKDKMSMPVVSVPIPGLDEQESHTYIEAWGSIL